MTTTSSQNKNILILTLVVLAAMAILLALNIEQILLKPEAGKYIGLNEVRGIAIEHKGLMYTLNFEQQNSVIESLNRAIPIGKPPQEPADKSLNFSKLVIYRFNKPDISLVPVRYEEYNLIFNVPEWNKNGYLKDTSYGNLEKLLATTYDP